MKPKLADLPQPVRKVVPVVLEALRKSYAARPRGLTSTEVALISVLRMSAHVHDALLLLVKTGEIERYDVDRDGWTVEVFRPRQPEIRQYITPAIVSTTAA